MFKSNGKLCGLDFGFGLGAERVFFEDAVHLQEEFAHHRRQRHLGRFAFCPQVRVKFPRRGFFHPRPPPRPPHRRPQALDGDVILAAQALSIGGRVATENVGHRSLFVEAAGWKAVEEK